MGSWKFPDHSFARTRKQLHAFGRQGLKAVRDVHAVSYVSVERTFSAADRAGRSAVDVQLMLH